MTIATSSREIAPFWSSSKMSNTSLTVASSLSDRRRRAAVPMGPRHSVDAPPEMICFRIREELNCANTGDIPGDEYTVGFGPSIGHESPVGEEAATPGLKFPLRNDKALLSLKPVVDGCESSAVPAFLVVDIFTCG